MKKRLIPFLAFAVIVAISMTSVVYAHTGDVFAGSYTNNQQRNLQLRISTSAQTSLMNKDVYESALKWNNISSNVRVAVIMETPGMPSIAGTMGVYDGRGGNLNGPNLLDEGDYGMIMYFDSSGNRITHNDVCSYVKILINTNHPDYNKVDDPTKAAAMNFTHEVGHALMLAHPAKGASGHAYWNYYPYAVMNQGLPQTNKEVSDVPTDHDKACLKAKWGA